jgi:hypothetical protein
MLECFDPLEVRISCHYPHLPKNCVMEDKSKPHVYAADYYSKCSKKREKYKNNITRKQH